MGYAYILLVFLIILNFFTSSQWLFQEADWSTVAANNLHLILLVCTLACLVAVDIKNRRRQPEIQEDAKSFIKTFIFGGAWLLILISFYSIPLDIFTQLQMALYFWKGAAIEELLFRYALPRLLNFSGYGYWIAQLVSNGLFSVAHYFVWDFNIVTMIMGMMFGFGCMIAFAFGRSFMGIVWSHMIYNLVLIGANAWFLLTITGIVIAIYIVRDYLR